MKKMVFYASLAALFLSGCGLTSSNPSSDTTSPEWSDEWAEYSAENEKSGGSWKSQSAWGNPPGEKKGVVTAPLPDIEETKSAPVLSRPRFSPSEASSDIHDAVKVDRVVETSTLRPSDISSPVAPSAKPGSAVLVQPPLVEPVKPTTQPIQPVKPAPTVIHAQELKAPQLMQPPSMSDSAMSVPDSSSVPSSVSPAPSTPSSEARPVNSPQAIRTEAEVEASDPRQAIEMAVVPFPELDGRIRSSWGDQVLTPSLRLDLDAAVLGAVSLGSSAHTASDGTTKFWVERKGSRGACQVFEVMRGGTASNSAIKDRGEAVFCGG